MQLSDFAFMSSCELPFVINIYNVLGSLERIITFCCDSLVFIVMYVTIFSSCNVTIIMCVCVNLVWVHIYIFISIGFLVELTFYIYMSVFLISLYGAPLAQRASYLALHSTLFGSVVQLVMIVLSLTALTLS